MGLTKSSLKVIVLILILVRDSISFESQYLGNYLNDEDYKDREVCSTKVCMLDNDRLIYSATHESKVQPCDDFREFAMGEFIKHRKLNDRYQFLGFDNYVDRLYRERQRKFLSKRVAKNDPNYVKVLKTFYAKCVSANVAAVGVNDTLSYLADIVGSPVFSKESWNDENFQLSKLFSLEFDQMMSLISSDAFNPHVYSSVLLEENQYWKPDSDWQKDIKFILNRLDVPRNESAAAIEDFRKFLATKDETIIANGFAGDKTLIENIHKYPGVFTPETIKNSFGVDPELQVFTTEHLSEILPSFSTLDVEKFMENIKRPIKDNRASKYFHRYENGTFGLPKFTLKLLELLERSDKRTLANNIALSFLYVHRKSFITHSFTKQEAKESGTTRSQQRFEQCIEILESTMRPAMQAMFAREFFDKGTQDAVKQWALDAIDDVTNVPGDTYLRKTANEHSSHLRQLAQIVMFHKDILNGSFVEKLYEELELDGSQPLFAMVDVLTDFREGTKKKEWFELFEICCSKEDITISYDQNGSNLYIPVKFTLYPYFHPNRPRFFNMATIYDRTVYTLSKGIYDYLSETWRIPAGTAYSDIYDVTSMAVNRYQSWLNAGNQDLQLSAFKLTSLQMYWLSLAHRNTLKFHKNVPEKLLKQERLESEFLHVRFKNRTSFREAFKCGEMTDIEILQLKEFTEKEGKYVTQKRCEIHPDGSFSCVA